MKRCSLCLEEKEESLFALRSVAKQTYQAACRECRKKIDKDYWERNKHRKHETKRANSSRWRKERTAWLNKQKNRPCTDCGKEYPSCVMDFDHLGDKDFTIASSKLNLSKETLAAEIAKCEVVCANCHRIRTHILRDVG